MRQQSHPRARIPKVGESGDFRRIAGIRCRSLPRCRRTGIPAYRTDSTRRVKEDSSVGSTRTRLVKDLQQFRRKIGRRYRISRMILFGSRARGRARHDSDVDLLLVGERFRRKGAIERAYPLYLEWELDYSVNFLCYTPEEFRKLSKRPSIVRVALEEGIPITALR